MTDKDAWKRITPKEFACPLCELDTDYFRNKEPIGECWQCRVKGTEYTCSHCHIYFCDKCGHDFKRRHKLTSVEDEKK